MNGYRLEENGINCTDINECENTHPCKQKCINTDGSFECACKPGFHLNEDKTSCTECTIPNYGENCSQIYNCGQGGNRYDSVKGCICNEGWRGSDCNEDIDECSTIPHICGLSKICQNLQGSYKCICQNGFQLQGDACTDIDECVDESLNDCPQSTTICQNVYGNYTCDCKSGYEKNKNGECKDIDECKIGHGCSQICNNVDGGYNCGCYFGFTLENDRMTCEEVRDSCSLFPELNCTYGCKIQHDHQGVCFCEHGYKLDVDNRTCIDINECALNSSCDYNCTNTNGSFECQCAVGFKLQNDGKSCRECSKFFYGENCQMPCKCGRGASTCDHISGCQCKPGWEGDTCEHDINECDHNPCKGLHEICLNTPGSYRCTCTQGFDNSTGICEDTDECRDKSLCQHNCTNTEGNYTCSCMDGYKLSNGKDCSDIDECSTAKCHNCSNFPGGFKCFCDEGYRVNSTYCHNIDECKENTDNCSGNATCTDTTGSFGCECFNGFSGNGYVCIEINECANHTDNCSVNANCTNTIGSFRCNCLSGFDGDGYNCEDVDECTKYHNCSGYATCENTIGSYNCSCNKGYQGNGFSCGDINECKEINECSPYALCNNTDGSYNCNCKDGFSGDGYNCTDIDECVQEIHVCSENASCSNTNGSFHCTCLKGFRSNGYLCEDIDECKEDNNTCTQNAICTNFVGSHICSCSDGFKENGRACEDVNECTNNIHKCSQDALCINTKGNYNCSCNTGFLGNGFICKDIDECAAASNPCHVNATCENTAGNYSCSCQRGFKGNGVICTACQNFTFGQQCSKECACNINNTEDCNAVNGMCQCKDGWRGLNCTEDVNECKDNLTRCNSSLYQVCVNTDGSYHCECRYGGRNLSDCIRPTQTSQRKQTEAIVVAEVTFDIVKSKDEFLDNSKVWLEKINRTLQVFFENQQINGFLRVNVLSIEFGSIIVYYEIIGEKSQSKTMQIGVAESMLRLRSGKSKVLILDEVPRIKGAAIENMNGTKIVIDKSSSLCDVYESFAPCEVGQRCEVSSGTVVCVEVSKDSLSEKFIYIVVLGVSIPLVVVVIILVIICKCRYMRQLKTQKEKNLDNNNPRTGASGNIRGMNRGSQRTSDYDSINHKNVYRREYLELKDTNAYSSRTSLSKRKETVNQGRDNPDYTWDFIYETLDPDEKFQIKRPNISSNMLRHY